MLKLTGIKPLSVKMIPVNGGVEQTDMVTTIKTKDTEFVDPTRLIERTTAGIRPYKMPELKRFAVVYNIELPSNSSRTDYIKALRNRLNQERVA